MKLLNMHPTPSLLLIEHTLDLSGDVRYVSRTVAISADRYGLIPPMRSTCISVQVCIEKVDRYAKF